MFDFVEAVCHMFRNATRTGRATNRIVRRFGVPAHVACWWARSLLRHQVPVESWDSVVDYAVASGAGVGHMAAFYSAQREELGDERLRQMMDDGLRDQLGGGRHVPIPPR